VSDLSRSVESLGDSAPSFSNVQEVVSSTARGTSNAPLREGLPPSYRMRADAHYVDQLVAPVTRPTAASTKPPTTSSSETKAPSLAAVDAELASSLAAVLSSTALLAETTPRLARSVTVDMIRAEVHRATCTLRAASVLRHGVPEERRLVSVRQIVHRVAETVAPDARLRGISLDTNAAGAEGAISVDEELLASAFSGVVLMLAGALNRADGACLNVTATTEAGRATLAVEQEAVVVPEAWFTPLTVAAVDAQGGYQLVPLVALRQVAEAWGGLLVTSRLPHGTRVAVELPLMVRR
jgi:hypothetical protein